MRYLMALLVVAALAAPATALAGADLPLVVASQTEATITLSWTAVQGSDGYDFYVKGVRVSQTRDGSRSSVKFGKVEGCTTLCYEVEAWQKGTLARGGHPKAPACSNKLDDDGDGKVDYPGDPGCVSAQDTDETDPTPPPPGAHETVTASQFNARATAGATISNVTVTGSVTINAANVTVRNAAIQGTINLGIAAQHVTIDGSSAEDFVAHGSDYITITGSTLDGGPGKSCQNFIWPGPNRNGATHWLITGNTFRNYQCESPHSEALYVASDAAFGLIEGNTFTNNGSTSHIFFTWCNDQGTTTNLCATYGNGNGAPHDWSVRGNTFYDTWRAYYAVSIREELPGVAGLNICVDNHQTVTGPIIQPPNYGGNLAEFIVPWGTSLLRPSCLDPHS